LRDLPFEPMIQLPASTRLLTLEHDLPRQSMERAGDAHEIDIAVVDLDTPMLRCALRDYRQVRFAQDFAAAQGASLVLARPDTGKPVGGGYVGEQYALVSYWTPTDLQGKDWIRWYIYRHLPNHIPGSDQLVMWVKVN